MKRKVKWIWIACLTVLASLFAFAGCKFEKTLQDELTERNLTAQVTYYANGGLFENTDAVLDVYYEAGTKPAPLGLIAITNINLTPKQNYSLKTWWHVEVDPNTNQIVYLDEENKIPKASNREVDFTKKLTQNERWIIVAEWTPLVKVDVKLSVFDETDTLMQTASIQALDDIVYNVGDVVRSFAYDNEDTVKSTTTAPFKLQSKTHTFVDYYADANCTTPVPWPLSKADDQTTNDVIYAKYLVGDWDILSKPMDVKAMFDNGCGAGDKYYLKNDITMPTSLSVDSFAGKEFAGTFLGNGKTITNLTVNKTVSMNETEFLNNVSFFGKIVETAVIQNVTFENLTIKYTMRHTGNTTLYAIFTSCDANAQISGVTITGGKLDVLKENSVNVTNDLEVNFMYGGYTTDTEYEAIQNRGITVTDFDKEISSV